jgi:HPt (histidine-containing phosphotransfer) domain-containing protein
MEEKVAHLTKVYIASFDQKKQAIKSALTAFDSDGVNQKTVSTMKILTHNISGSAGMYGMHELGRRMKQLDKLIPHHCDNCILDVNQIRALAIDVINKMAIYAQKN